MNSNAIEGRVARLARLDSTEGARAKWSAWFIPGLLILGALPVSFGVLRLLQMAGISDLMPTGAPYLSSPVPLVAHIVSAALYALLGPFQFSAAIRRRWPVWHRYAGRLLVVCGLIVALSALWLTLAHLGTDLADLVLGALRVGFGSAMVVSIILGLTTILRRDVPHHRAWMIRAYAIGLGAATQMIILIAAEIIAGPPSDMSRALLIGTAWVFNLMVAELLIRRQRLRTVRPVSA